jgi:hypothetical protein
MTLQDELNAYKSAPAHPNFRPEFGPILARSLSSLAAVAECRSTLENHVHRDRGYRS